MQHLTQVLSDLDLLTMTCSPLLLPSSLYLQAMSSITSLLLCSISATHNKHIETLSLAVLQIFFWFIDCMLDCCSFCLTVAPSAWLLHLLPVWSFRFLHSNCTSSDLHVFFQIFNVLNEVIHQQLFPTFWFFNVSSTVTPTLTLSNVSLQHYCTSNSLHVKLHWTPLLIDLHILFHESHFFCFNS